MAWKNENALARKEKVKNKSWFTRVKSWWNNLLNPDHDWLDYDAAPDSLNSKFDNFVRQAKDSIGAGLDVLLNPDTVTNLINSWSGAHMTNSQIEANQMSMQNAEDIYQRQVAGMQKAGLNPALMYQSGAASSAPVTQGSPGSLNMSDVMQAIMVKPQIQAMKSQATMFEQEGAAAVENAKANMITARAAERNAGTGEFNAETNRLRQEVDAFVAKHNVRLTDNEADRVAMDITRLKTEIDQMPQRLAIAQQSADAQTRQAAASLQHALAAARQAAVAEKLSYSEITLRESQAAVNWANEQGQQYVNQYMPEHQVAEIRELGARSGMFDNQAEYLRKQGKVQWMQTITGYTNAVCNIVDTVTGVVPGKRSKVGF